MQDIFFSNFKKVLIDFKEHFESIGVVLSNSQKTEYMFSILNINPAFKIINEYLENNEKTQIYEIKTGTTPFSVSEELYGSQDMWWLILYANNFSGFDFVMDNNEMNQLAEILYQKEKTYSSKKVYFDLIFEYNQNKKKIIVVKPEEIHNMIREINRSINATN